MYTDTSTRISSMEVTLCLQSVTVINRQATFIDTSIRISSYVGSSVSLVYDVCGLTCHFHKYFHHNKLHGARCDRKFIRNRSIRSTTDYSNQHVCYLGLERDKLHGARCDRKFIRNS